MELSLRTKQILTLTFGLFAIGFFGSCSGVEFAERPITECNGSGLNCTSVYENGRKVNLYKESALVPEPKADILFVVDNSASMRVDQLKMAEKFNTFTSALTDIDWRIGITTTDVSANGMGGKLLSFAPGLTVLTSAISNFENLFYNTIQRPEEGSNDERGITAAIRIVKNRATQNFLRPEAHFSTIVLSDEDEGSFGGESVKNIPNEFVSTIEQYQSEIGKTKSHSFYSIIIKPGDTSCMQIQSQDLKGYEGKTYYALQKLINGSTGVNDSEVGSICDTNFTQNLNTIGTSLKEKVKPIPLPCVPIMEKDNRTLTYTIQRADAQNYQLDETKLAQRLLAFQPALPIGTRVDYAFKCYAL